MSAGFSVAAETLSQLSQRKRTSTAFDDAAEALRKLGVEVEGEEFYDTQVKVLPEALGDARSVADLPPARRDPIQAAAFRLIMASLRECDDEANEGDTSGIINTVCGCRELDTDAVTTADVESPSSKRSKT
jgi:hypothetical protein